MNIGRVAIVLLISFVNPAATARSVWSADGAVLHSQESSRPIVARHLLLDSRVVDQSENATLTVGAVRKHAGNPLFGEDKPWEPRYDNMYANVIYDADERLYKCWYTPFVISELDENTPRDKRDSVKWNVSPRRFGLCYAVSQDGLRWQKPELGLIELRGSKENNIILLDVHGADVIKDPRETDPSRRYKMFGTVGGLGPHMVWFSPDGLRWSEPKKLELGGRSDTHNNVFWCPIRNEYVGITRVGFQPRTIGRTSSPDFVHWSKVEEVMKPTSNRPHLHDVVVFPYENVYLGLVGAYDVVADRQWAELAWSPDTIQWNRIQPGTPFVANSAKQGDYDWGCIFAARPITCENEIRVYYSGCNGKFFDWRDGFLCLATLGKDRWAGYRSDDPNGGLVLTRPLLCQSDKLVVTADVKGSLTIEVIDASGTTLAESQSLDGELTDKPIQWKSPADFRSQIGNRVRLRFKLNDVVLYSFAFVK